MIFMNYGGKNIYLPIPKFCTFRIIRNHFKLYHPQGKYGHFKVVRCLQWLSLLHCRNVAMKTLAYTTIYKLLNHTI